MYDLCMVKWSFDVIKDCKILCKFIVWLNIKSDTCDFYFSIT